MSRFTSQIIELMILQGKHLSVLVDVVFSESLGYLFSKFQGSIKRLESKIIISQFLLDLFERIMSTVSTLKKTFVVCMPVEDH